MRFKRPGSRVSCESCRGSERLMVSNGSLFVDNSPVSESVVVVLMEYFDFDFETEVTVVLRRVVALEALSMEEKICQLPPSICIAPSTAMQTNVSRPWMRLRFWP